MALSDTARRVFMLASTLVTGGAENVLRVLATKLSDYGFEPEVACLYAPGEIGEEIARAGIRVHSGLARGRFDAGTPVRLARILRNAGGKVLLTLDHHDAVFWGALAATLARVRGRVLAVHSTGLWDRGTSLSRSDRVVLRMYTKIVALAEGHREYLIASERIDPERIVVINNGVDTDRFHPARSEADRLSVRDTLGLSRDHFVVTIVAALRPEKNHELFLRAAAAVVARGVQAVFLVVGEGKEAGKLQALSRDLSLDRHVRFLGRRDDVPEILAASDALVLCSHPVVETFPLSVLEGMAAGTPVVATDVGSIAEMIEDGRDGILIEPGDAGALTEALLSLQGDPGGRRRMGELAARKVIERYTERQMLAGYATLLWGILGNNGGG